MIRELKGSKVVKEFSSGCWRPENDEHIREAAEACLLAHRRGRWPKEKTKKVLLLWAQIAANTKEDLRARVPREGSRKNAEGHLREIATWDGPASAVQLERWAQEKDPVKQPAAFRNRIETLSHIDKAGDIDLTASIEKLRKLKPTGSAKRIQEQTTQQIKAIPDDQALQDWLDRLSGHEQWTLALIATYGLRPSEAWHAEGIDERGWITIPGEGLTKTERHFAPPLPAEWLKRYRLRENFQKYQQQLNERFQIRWTDRKGVKIPINNSQASNALYKAISEERIEKLWVNDEWVRPYDLRHTYAIRCETSLDPVMLATPREDFAQWLGHGWEVHKRVYLRFMTAERKKQAMQGKFEARQPATGEGLSAEIKQKLKKLEQLERLLAS